MPPLDKVYDYSQYGGLLVEKQDRVMTITLNAPESMNAFSAEMHYSMSRIWEDVQDDPEVNVVVLTGAGRAFSACRTIQITGPMPTRTMIIAASEPSSNEPRVAN